MQERNTKAGDTPINVFNAGDNILELRYTVQDDQVSQLSSEMNTQTELVKTDEAGDLIEIVKT